MTANGLGKIEQEGQQNRKLLKECFLLDAIKRAIFKTLTDGIQIDQRSIDAVIAYERFISGAINDLSKAIEDAGSASTGLFNLYLDSDWRSGDVDRDFRIKINLTDAIYKFLNPQPDTKLLTKELRLEIEADFKWVNSNYGHIFPNLVTADTAFYCY